MHRQAAVLEQGDVGKGAADVNADYDAGHWNHHSALRRHARRGDGDRGCRRRTDARPGLACIVAALPGISLCLPFIVAQRRPAG